MEISVVVLSYNSRDVLRRALERLAAQDFPRDAYEVIVSDDGSTDGTADMIRALAFPAALRHVVGPHAGISAVRNRGADAARGRVVLFVDADFWAEPGLLAAHHRRYPPDAARVAVQGATPIDPDSLTTPFMRVKEVSPDLTVRSRHRMSPYHTIFRNASVLKTDLDGAGGFDEAFPGYGYEDLDLALRMSAEGVVFEYEPDAVGYHHHVEDLAGVRRKMHDAGRSAWYLWNKHGRERQLGLFLEILPWMMPVKRLVYGTPLVMPLLRGLVPIGERRDWLLVLNECYKNLLQEAYYGGVFEAQRESRGAARRHPHTSPGRTRA
jgi:glycosyltransferase involved in cell wall biosynthesis